MKSVLTMDGVGLTYHTLDRETVAVKNVSFEINDGEFVSIIGPSGCGKTTLLGIMAGLLKPTEGRILFEGRDISQMTDKPGYMLQHDELFPWRTIEKNVMLPLEIKSRKTHKNDDYPLLLLDKYGLGEFKKRYPRELSGGMRQRVALIRTLASRPSLLLLDEPFSALDYQTRLNVCDDVYGIIKKEKKTTVLVTHDISEAVSVSDRIIMISSRPARVRKIYTLDFDRSTTPLMRRESPHFRQWFEILWRELNNEDKKQL